MIKDGGIARNVDGRQVGMCHSFLPWFHFLSRYFRIPSWNFFPILETSSIILALAHANQCCSLLESNRVLLPFHFISGGTLTTCHAIRVAKLHAIVNYYEVISKYS
jgi:hypothetical protein